MANGRLARCTINPYSAGLVYENTSGSAASISVNAQLKSKEDNTDITVALESTSRTVSTSCTAQTVCAPINCLASIVTCSDATYAGFYGANGGCFMPLYTNTSGTVTCYPYMNTYSDCITIYIGGCVECNNVTIQCYCETQCVRTRTFTSTPSNAALVVNRNAYENPKILAEERSVLKINSITFDVCGNPRFYTNDILTTEEQRARNFVNPTCTSLTIGGNTYASAAVDYWASCPSVIGSRHYTSNCSAFYGIFVNAFYCCCVPTTCQSFYRVSSCPSARFCAGAPSGCCVSVASHFGYTLVDSSCTVYFGTDCSCCLGAFGGSVSRPYFNNNPFPLVGACECAAVTIPSSCFVACCAECIAIKNYTRAYDVQTSNRGPFWLSGCGVQAVKNLCSDCSYIFTGHINEEPYSHIYGTCFCFYSNRGYLSLETRETACLVTCINCLSNNMIYPMKWLSYNPVTNCNYFMFFGSDKGTRGIYSINQSKIRCSTICNCSVDGYLANTAFGCTSFETFFTKVACLPAPLIDCDPNNFCPTPIFRTEKCGWRFSVNDSGTWKEYCSNNMVDWYARTSFYTQYSGGSYSTTGTTIVRYCDCFFNVIDNSTYLDYQLTANNYERTGLVVSNNDKIYVHNPSGYELAVNVWGYEG